MLSVPLSEVQRASDAVRADWKSLAPDDDTGGSPAEPSNNPLASAPDSTLVPRANTELPLLLYRQTGVSLAELEALEREGLLEKIPRAEDGSLTSVGSARHAEGNCQPCLFWFRKSCTKGIRCSYCHIRHEGLRNKRIRPSKQTRMKLREQMGANGETGPLALGDKRNLQQQRPRKPTEGDDSSSEDSSDEDGEGEAGRRRKGARKDIPPDLFLDAKGNSRPSWLRDEDPPAYGYPFAGAYGSAQPQYGAPPQYGAALAAPALPQYGAAIAAPAAYGATAAGAPHAGYGYPAAYPAPTPHAYGQQPQR